MFSKEELLARLAPFGQEQLLTFWDELHPEERERLSEEIARIDLEYIAELYKRRNDPPAAAALAERAEEPSAYHLSDLRERVDTPDFSDRRMNPLEAIALGEEALRAGRIALAVVAGGQGTRLDFPHAKGIFPIGPVSGATLFQIHIERIRAMTKKYGARIPFCIQTSPATHQETIDFFRANQNFGLDDEDVLIFCQGTMPSVGFDGKILLSQKDIVAKSPDGHGGFLACINDPAPDAWTRTSREEGVLADLQKRGVTDIFYFQIDNPVIDLCSPEFIGYHLISGSEFSSQVVRKEKPLDRVGNMVMVDGVLRVIEYSDLPDVAANRRKEDGSLAIWAGSIAVHLMNVAFLKAKADYAGSLPFHIAKKKVPYIVTDPTEKDADGKPLFGRKIKPSEPNAIKFEKFIFDLLPLARHPIVVEIDAATGFVPLKNHPSAATDNPQTVKAGLANLYKGWLQQLGIELADGVIVEISPLFANSAKELQTRLKESGRWPEGNRITESVYWD